MHYERAPRPEDRSWMRRRLRSATAALGSNCSGACGGKEVQEGIGKSAGEWHFTLRDGPTVGGFQWRRVPMTANFDGRCQALPDRDSEVDLPIELRLGGTETEVLQVLGRPTVRKGNTVIYEHEHEEPIHNEPYTFMNTVTVVLRHGLVWAIQVDKSTQN